VPSIVKTTSAVCDPELDSDFAIQETALFRLIEMERQNNLARTELLSRTCQFYQLSYSAYRRIVGGVQKAFDQLAAFVGARPSPLAVILIVI
jgi:hypothetical protein